MGHYIKAQRIQCHYNFDPDCPRCHGTGKDPYDEHGLPCRCGLDNMTFDEPKDALLAVEAEPLPDGGMRVHMKDIKQGEN